MYTWQERPQIFPQLLYVQQKRGPGCWREYQKGKRQRFKQVCLSYLTFANDIKTWSFLHLVKTAAQV